MGVKFGVSPEGRIYVEGVRKWVTRKTRHCPTTQFQTYTFFYERKNWNIEEPNFSLREWKRSEKKLAEEYCWAITQAAGRSRWGRSGSTVLKFVFQLSCLVHLAISVICYDLCRIFRDVTTA